MAPSASGELWGLHLMPEQLTMDFLLPNGIVIPMIVSRDATLTLLKDQLWIFAKKFPLYELLQEKSDYIFITVALGGDREEFYDENRRICDLHLFVPVLRLVEPEGNRKEKQLNHEIGIAIGRPLSEFDVPNAEIKDARVSFFKCSEDIVKERRKEESIDLYCFPCDIVLPDKKQLEGSERFVQEFIDTKKSSEAREYLVSVWMNCASNRSGAGQKITLRVDLESCTPEQLIQQAIRQRIRRLSPTNSDTDPEQCAKQCADDYVLKVAGSQLYLWNSLVLIRYKYISDCFNGSSVPLLMLMSYKAIIDAPTVSWSSVQPSFIRSRQSVCMDNLWRDGNEPLTLWELDSFFRLRICVASYINITDVDKIYVKVGIFHGTEQLAVGDTSRATPSNPRWNEVLEFDLYNQDIPRAAQICFSICSVRLRKQKEEHCALAWGNLRLFDYNDRFVDEHYNMYLWSFPKGFDGFLNPLGHCGSNPNRDSPRLEVEFECFARPVLFPTKQNVYEYVQFLQKWKLRKNPELAPVAPENTSEEDIKMLNILLRRGPSYELTEDEKAVMWRLREYCKSMSDSLPRLLDAVTWSSREEVAQVYVLLEDWTMVSPDTALELLDIKYPDKAVRSFAVKSLDKLLDDGRLKLYLMSLVQVLKYEAFIDNDLAMFLLKRSLINQQIGHLLFWLARAELQQNPQEVWCRFGVLLEAFCRGCGPYLNSLLKQVEAVEKLETLSTLVKERKEESAKLLTEELAHNKEVLESFESPLDNSQLLGTLQIDECRVLGSAKRPLWLVWKNPDPLAELVFDTHEIIFKNGDDLRQDMLTLQVLRIMDNIWKSEGNDFCLTPYSCLPMGKNIGMIEVVRNSKTIFEIQCSKSAIGAFSIGTAFLNRWIKYHNKDKERYAEAVDKFTRSCAGYCVATFVLGIKDRHQDNIMVTEDGRIFHIDFGHFLGHYKKKLGINRDRVPFVLTDHFITVIARGSSNPRDSDEFKNFQRLCGKAYMILHKHSRLFISLFTMMLCMGIPELQRPEDIHYLRRTLAANLKEKDALAYFQEQFNVAYEGAWTTKTNWFFHSIRHG